MAVIIKSWNLQGKGAHNLDIDERLVLCNLAVEAGAKTGIVEPDEKVVEYVESRGRKAENLLSAMKMRNLKRYIILIWMRLNRWLQDRTRLMMWF